MLSKNQILKKFEEGKIVIDPFNPNHLNLNSYDVCLGEYYITFNSTAIPLIDPFDDSILHNPKNYEIRKIPEEGFILHPRETVLSHTEEFIGSLDPYIVPELRSKSSIERLFVEISGSSGYAEPGFINRWVFEISNRGSLPVKLYKGMRIASIFFHELSEESPGFYKGSYQEGEKLEDIKRNWNPKTMLPKSKSFKPLNL